MGLASAAGLVGSHQVACLQDWVQAANADLLLVEALLGKPLDPNDSLATALPGIFVFDSFGKPFLARYAVPSRPSNFFCVNCGESVFLVSCFVECTVNVILFLHSMHRKTIYEIVLHLGFLIRFP